MSNLPSSADEASAPRPALNLEFYRKRAKTLLKEMRAGSSATQERFAALQIAAPVNLAQAQLVIARESGYSSWTQLKRQAEAVAETPPLRPYVRDTQWYLDRAEGLLSSHRGKMRSASQLIRRFHPRFAASNDSDLETAQLDLADAQLVQSRQHGFESWDEFVTHIEALANGQAQEPFLLAFEAIESGENETLRRLLNEHPWLTSAQGSNGNSLLNLALGCRRVEACRVLLRAGAPVNQGNNYGWTPLHQVATGNNIALAEELIAAGGDLTLSARGEGGTPLVQALFWGHDAMADALAKHDISPKNLRVAAGLGRLDLVQGCFKKDGTLTKEAGEAREFYRPHGGFPEWAPSSEPQEILDEAFTYACRNGRTSVLPLLIERGANIGADPYRGNGLIWATYTGRRETVRWLLEHGADINGRTTFGGSQHGVGVTALHLAVQQGELEDVRFLVGLGADPDIPDHLFNSTPLGWAEFFDHKEVATYLMSLPNVGVLNLAARGLTERLAKVLEREPGLVNGSPRETRFYPLHRAVENGHLDTVQLLLERGADPKRRIYDGQTALDIAVGKGERGMIDLLSNG